MKRRRLAMRMLMTSTLTICLTCVATLTGCPGANNAPIPGETRTFNGIEFQWCPPGTFLQGSPADEEGRSPYETQHQVTLTKGFWLGKYEVTQTQWANVMGTNPSYFGGPNLPVEKVSWDDAHVFLAALNRGRGFATTYRLPTEAEWEYACRAGTTTRFYWGDDLNETEIDKYAWYEDNSSDSTHDVGGKMPNAWGLHDMIGNVLEWCQDRWPSSYPDGPVTNPQGSTTGDERVCRGGYFWAEPVICRSAYRNEDEQDFRSALIGFRLLRTQP